MTERVDVAVIGAGPSGASAAFWLARSGHRVALFEKKRFPREKTCGDGLTPRAIRQLIDMDLESKLSHFPICHGLRSHAFGRVLELEWPSHPAFPSYGRVVPRAALDQIVAEGATSAGAHLFAPYEVTAVSTAPTTPCVVTARDHDDEETRVTATYVVVADGANSRIGRQLGAVRDRKLPVGTAVRQYFSSPHADRGFLESYLDLRDRNGTSLPGYGWVFPAGDGKVNVGAGLLSTATSWKEANTTVLMDAFLAQIADDWQLNVDEPLGPLRGGKLPCGLSIAPRQLHNVLFVGDAVAAINPFNGEGISYGYETGRLAADVINQALRGDDPGILPDYSTRLSSTYGPYYGVARRFASLIGRPGIMRSAVWAGIHCPPVMSWALRAMSNLTRPGAKGPAEIAMGLASSLAGSADRHRR